MKLVSLSGAHKRQRYGCGALPLCCAIYNKVIQGTPLFIETIPLICMLWLNKSKTFVVCFIAVIVPIRLHAGFTTYSMGLSVHRLLCTSVSM